MASPAHERAPRVIKGGPKMARRIVERAITLLRRLMWKVVRPQDLEPGDHVYRHGLYRFYSHHVYMTGIYVVEGYVINFTRTESRKIMFPTLSQTSHNQGISSPCRKCQYQESTNPGVVKTCLDCFRWDGKQLQSLHCYEYGWPLLGFKLARPGTCIMLTNAKLPHQVVDKAGELHANEDFGDYNLISNNCKHFATFCRTGIRRSEQTAFVGDCERKIKEWTMRLLQRN